MGTKNISGVRKVVRGGKPHWVVDFRYDDAAGLRQRFRRDASVQNFAATLAEAKRLMQRAAETGNPLGDAQEAPAKPTLRSFVEGAFEKRFMPSYRPATRDRYRALLRQGILAFFGDMPLEEVQRGPVREYIAKLEERGVQVKGPVNFVRTIVRAAREEKLVDQMPDFSKLVKTGKKLPSTYSDDDVVRVRSAAVGWVKVAVDLAALAGLRLGEVLAIEVRDVDLVGGQLHVRRALSLDTVMEPKSGDERPVPITDDLRDTLKEAVRGKLPRARLVVDEQGRTPRRQEVLRHLKKLLVQVDVQERSFHALRHYFCTTLVRRGVNVEAVRQLAGHTSLAVTSRYVHANSADLVDAVQKLSARP